MIIELEPESLCLAKDTVFVHGDTFTPKDELHVTLIRLELATSYAAIIVITFPSA